MTDEQSADLSEQHAEFLRSCAISDALISSVCSTQDDGIAFDFTGVTGTKATQLRLDDPSRWWPEVRGSSRSAEHPARATWPSRSAR